MYSLFPYQRDLVNEARLKLAQGNKGVLIVSPPGSGKSIVIAEIARLTTLKGNRTMFTVHRKELIQQIKTTFAKQAVNPRLCTIMTVGKIANRLGKLPKPDLIIVDETHHARAKTYRKIFDYYKDVPRLGFTGSPWRMSGKGFKDIYSTMVQGPSVRWLINHHKLAEYHLFGFNRGDASLLKKSSTGDYTQKSMDAYNKSIIHGDIIKSWEQDAGDRKTIVYCHSVAASKQIAKEFQQAGIDAAEADAKTPAKERDQIMSDFKAGKIQVLCNCDLISEGFNVPDCSCVVLLRPTESLVMYLQQAMRCMRYQPGKQAVILDQVGNYVRFGLPERNFHWTLEDRPRKKNKHDSLGIKRCPQCFWVVASDAKICPNPECNYIFPLKQRKPKVMTVESDEQLHEVNKKLFTTNYILTMSPNQLTTAYQLREYARAKHYKPGWVYYQEKIRGWI